MKTHTFLIFLLTSIHLIACSFIDQTFSTDSSSNSMPDRDRSMNDGSIESDFDLEDAFIHMGGSIPSDLDMESPDHQIDLGLSNDMERSEEMSIIEYSLIDDFQNDWDQAVYIIADEPARLRIDGSTTLGVNSLGDVSLPSNITVVIESGSIDCADFSLTINGDVLASPNTLSVSGVGVYRFNGIEQIEVPWFAAPEIGIKIQFAIRSASTSQTKVIYFPAGNYELSNIANASSGTDTFQRGSMILLNLQEHSGLTFRGAGETDTRLEWTSLTPQTLNNWMFLIDGRQNQIENITIEDLTLDGNARSDDYVQGINLDIDPETDRVSFTESPVVLENGMKIRFRTEQGTLPESLINTNSYFLVNKEGNTFQLSDSLFNSVPIDIGSEGTQVRATYQRFATAIGAIGPSYAGTGSDLHIRNAQLRNLTVEYFGNTGIGIREGEWVIDNVLVQDNSRDSWGDVPGHHGLYVSNHALVSVFASDFLRNGYGFDFWGGNATQGQTVQVSFEDSRLNENWFGGCKLGSADFLTQIQGSLHFSNVHFNRNGTSGLMETIVASEVNIPIHCRHCEFKENTQNGINFGVDATGAGLPLHIAESTISENGLNGVLVTGTAMSLTLDTVEISGNGEFGLYANTEGLMVSDLQLQHAGNQNGVRLVGSGQCQMTNSSLNREEGITIQPSAGSVIHAHFDNVDLGFIYLGDRSESRYTVRNGSTWFPDPPNGQGIWDDSENGLNK